MELKSRTAMATRNVLYGYIGNIITICFKFFVRTIFIYTIGITYLGINGLFINILGVLSFTELGIGTAMNYSLYKPVAYDDTNKIKSLMRLYRNAYRVIAVIVSVLGLLMIPLLPYIIKGGNGIDHIEIYYLIFLFNTVSSYFITYKYGLVHAEQKGYLLTNCDTIANIVISVIQCLVLIVFRNFLFYLIAQSIVQLAQKIVVSIYINKMYPYLLEKNVQPLDFDEKNTIKTNVKALILHKIGDVSIYQTDNIIISSFINITLVGIVSNYDLILTSVTMFLNIIFNSIVSTLGNFIATENAEKQLYIFKIYNFLGFWLYGFTAVCIIVLIQPFIFLWVGEENVIDQYSLVLLVVNHYFMGQRLTVGNIKVAGGIFVQDKYVALIQAAVNLITSVIFVQLIGLPGVYLGTVISALVPGILRPVIVYKYLFKMSSVSYFKTFIRYFSAVFGVAVLMILISNQLFVVMNWFNFAALTAITIAASNSLLLLMFHKTEEVQYIFSKLLGMIRRGKHG